MKRAYQISNSVGTVAGVFEGFGRADALAAMHRRAGYSARAERGEVVFESQEHADLCGGVAEWIITPVNKKAGRR